MFGPLESEERPDECRCEPAFDGGTLVVESDGCPGEGALETSADCRETTIRALADRDADERSAGWGRD